MWLEKQGFQSHATSFVGENKWKVTVSATCEAFDGTQATQHVIWPNRTASYGQSQVLVVLEQTTLLDKAKTRQLKPYGLNDLTFSAIGKGKND